MTKTHKVVSDMSLQLSEQISRAIEIDETQTCRLYNLTSRILRESARRKINSKSMGTATKLGILLFSNEKKYEKRVRSYDDKNRHFENSLDDAIKKIQKTNAKKMFKVIEMNMKYGPEKTIDHVMTFTETKNLGIIDLKLLEGTVRKKNQH